MAARNSRQIRIKSGRLRLISLRKSSQGSVKLRFLVWNRAPRAGIAA